MRHAYRGGFTDIGWCTAAVAQSETLRLSAKFAFALQNWHMAGVRDCLVVHDTRRYRYLASYNFRIAVMICMK